MKFKLRTFVVLLSLVLCYLFLKDTIDWYFFMPEAKKDLTSLSANEIDKLPKNQKEAVVKIKKKRKKVISLGLDLQGGLYLVLSVNETLLKKQLVQKYTDLVKADTNNNKLTQAQRDKKAADLVKSNFAYEKKAAADSAYSRIANRVDQFGIAEPIIQKGADNRIYVSLAGVKDPQAAEELVSKAGKLTFQLVDWRTSGRFLTNYRVKNPALFKNYDKENDTMIANGARIPADFKVPADSALYYLWTRDVYGIQRKQGGLFLKKNVLLDGKHIKDAKPDRDNLGGKIRVAFTLDSEGAKIFAKVTGRYAKEQLAIVLDGKVKSYPQIQGKITGGSGIITGNYTLEEASQLSAILKAGSFDVGLRIEEKRSVGPSLGKDSVNAGVTAVLIGFGLVFVFMLIYYKFAGFIADIALLFNFVLVLAVMTQFGATLTLPGIAGLILTLGMSVDANVIVFERIKEELRGGKTQLKGAINKGFNRAFRTIFDANLTTLLAALVLMQLGTGAIKGFAVTLFIGILSSMYTALFVSRLCMESTISVFKLKKLAI